MQGNSFVTEPRLLIIPEDPPLHEILWAVAGTFKPRSAAVALMPDAIASFEHYVSLIIAASATRIVIPTTPASLVASSRQLRAALPKSFAARTKFGDRFSIIWATVQAYLAPALDGIPADHVTQSDLDVLAWQTYLFALAMKSGSEVSLNVQELRARCQSISRVCRSPEGRARLSILAGLYATYDQVIRMPTFQLIRSSDVALRDRFDEIVNDAHFLETSRLRQFFGVAQNRQAILRDLRTLVRWITKTKKWATGVISAGTQVIATPSVLSKAAENALDALNAEERQIPVITTRFEDAIRSPTRFTSFVTGRRSLRTGEWGSVIVIRPGDRLLSAPRKGGG